MSKKPSLITLILIITTTVYSFSSMSTAFVMMGTKSLPWFIISALCYFIPYALIVSQYAKYYAHQSGTIYDWLKESLSPRIAFITTALWYGSYFTWMVSLFLKLWIPLSILLFGKDISKQDTIFGISTNIVVPCLACFSVALITLIIIKGFKNILSLLTISSLAMVGLLILSLISNSFLISQHSDQFLTNLSISQHAPSFFKSTSNDFLSQLPFFIFAITAFGGLDTVSSLADRTGDSRRRFPKAILISTLIIVTLYICGIILWSGANNLNELREIEQLHLGNIMYGLTGSMAKHVAATLGLSASASELLYQIYYRYTAFVLFTAYLGLLSTISYGPLKSILMGTPASMWSQRMTKLNKHHMPTFALCIQAVVIMLVIIAISIQNSAFKELYNQLTYMTNIARSLPYFIVALSFPFFVKKALLPKKELYFNRNYINNALAISTCTCVFIAVLFQIIDPLKQGEIVKAITLIIGPFIFALIANYIYNKKNSAS